MKKITFGRSGDNDIVFDNDSVSRHHGYLLVDGKKVSIVDDNSLNGIFVNGMRITDKALLSPGDKVVVAKLYKLDWQRYCNIEAEKTIPSSQSATSIHESPNRIHSNRNAVEGVPNKIHRDEEKKSDWKKSFLNSAGKILKYIVSTVITLVVMALINKWLRG